MGAIPFPRAGVHQKTVQSSTYRTPVFADPSINRLSIFAATATLIVGCLRMVMILLPSTMDTSILKRSTTQQQHSRRDRRLFSV